MEMFRTAENTDTAEMDAIVVQNGASASNNASGTNDTRNRDEQPRPRRQLDSTSDVCDNKETFSTQDCVRQTSILDNTEVCSPTASTGVETQATTTEREFNKINVGDMSKHGYSHLQPQMGVDFNQILSCTTLRSSLAEHGNLQKVDNLEDAINTIDVNRCEYTDSCVSVKHRQKCSAVESQVDGMICGSISRGIESTVSGTKGVEHFTASPGKNMATVPHDSELVAPGDRFDGIEDIGLGATLKKNTPIDERSRNSDAYVFSIEGMTCRSCAQTIEMCLSAIEGIGDVSVSLEYNMATVQSGRHKLDPTNVIGAIDDLGFSASLLSSPNNEPDETGEFDPSGRYMDIIPNYAGHPGK